MTFRATSRRQDLAMLVTSLLGLSGLAVASSGGCSSSTGDTAAPSPTAPATTKPSASASASSSSSTPPTSSSTPPTSSTPPASSSSTPPASVCGDGVCVHEANEDCMTCAADCGACAVCGDGTCESGLGKESCDSCPADCGTCSECGDGTCSADSDETCTTCPKDCGMCASCGDGTCDDSETCSSCAKDCGACQTCGDGTCDGAKGETCSTCDADCGACATCGDGKCNGNEDCTSCKQDCGQCQRKGCVQGDFKPYWGNLHAHTSISHDAKGPPGEAFNHARNVTKPALDFMWLSDHRGNITKAEWDNCVAAANKFTTADVFAAGCGFEKSVFGDAPGGDNDVGGIGHFNVLFPDKLFDLPFNVPGIYKGIDECEPCVGQFNHPGFPGTPGKTFNSYQFFGVARDKVRLIEFNGPGDLDLRMGAYFTALGKGWMVSPSWNEDNHSKGWGDSPNATLVWAEKLTRPDVRAAVKAHRSAATNDDNASIKVLADDVCWMGSELQGLGPTTISVELKDKNAAEGFTTVKLLGPGNKELDTTGCQGKNPCKVKFSLTLTKATHLVVLARQKDNDYLVSAPLWYSP